jgi:branched-chain amino acid transport system substrate-binding protein
MADAMKRSKNLDGVELRNAIAATKNFPGVTGSITIGPERNAVGKKIVIEEVKNGQLTLKATIEPTGAGAAPGSTQ